MPVQGAAVHSRYRCAALFRRCAIVAQNVQANGGGEAQIVAAPGIYLGGERIDRCRALGGYGAESVPELRFQRDRCAMSAKGE